MRGFLLYMDNLDQQQLSLDIVFAKSILTMAEEDYQEIVQKRMPEQNKKLALVLFGSVLQFVFIYFLFHEGFFSDWYDKFLFYTSAAFALTAVCFSTYFLFSITPPNRFAKDYFKCLKKDNREANEILLDVKDKVLEYDQQLKALDEVISIRSLILKIVSVCLILSSLIGAIGF